VFSAFELIKVCYRLTGDYGFDPLGLGEDPESLRWYVQAELVHCRFAMAGVAGILFTDVRYISCIITEYTMSSI
jgi:Chlorophyll A-B binding protein